MTPNPWIDELGDRSGPVAPDVAATDTASEPGTETWLQRGLSASAVDARVEEGAVNRSPPAASQPWTQIVRRNTLTPLNFLLVVLGGATLATGSLPDATFLAIAVINSVTGTVQELRAKRSLDRLAVISAVRSRVIRDSQERLISVEDVVVDDLLDLRPGDQLPADAVVVADFGEVDESLATGESDPVVKTAGDDLLSGSWIVAGSLRARVVKVGAGSYANRLAQQARRFSLASSELMAGINGILRVLSWILVVVGPILLIRQLQTQPWRSAVRSAVGGLVGMIPEGLVLLTTLAFLTAAVRLGRRHVLVQELPAVETLARVDTFCVDKTGTLTEGRVAFADLVIGGVARVDVTAALHGLAGGRAANATMLAIRPAVNDSPQWEETGEVPFSSARKWSAATFQGRGTWVLGAPEVVDAADPEELGVQAARRARQGSRVLILARGEAPLRDERLPDDLVVVGFVELREQVRAEASRTLAYFSEQGVSVRVVSGDALQTVRTLAERVGLPGAAMAVDARSLPSPDDSAFMAEVERHRVFGRVTPDQKRDIVEALREEGHTIAMTGDGVNDVLALKEADLGIAMGSGTAVARGVAQAVLVDDDFDALPNVVAEGRRVLSNVERVASLFLVKNVYSLLISLAVSVTGWQYPFLPRHLTLVSGVAIGIPGFFLALAPNSRRFEPGFVRRVLGFSLVAGTITAAAVIGTYYLARLQGANQDESRTAAIIVVAIVSLWVLAIVARPLTRWRALLIVAMAGVFVGACLVPGVNTFFSLNHRPSDKVMVEVVALAVGASLLIELLSRVEPVKRFIMGQPTG